MAQKVKNPLAMQETGFDLLHGRRMATHSSSLAWEITWTEESGGPKSIGSQRVGYR